jgi:hypothetical protein
MTFPGSPSVGEARSLAVEVSQRAEDACEEALHLQDEWPDDLELARLARLAFETHLAADALVDLLHGCGAAEALHEANAAKHVSLR